MAASLSAAPSVKTCFGGCQYQNSSLIQLTIKFYYFLSLLISKSVGSMLCLAWTIWKAHSQDTTTLVLVGTNEGLAVRIRSIDILSRCLWWMPSCFDTGGRGCEARQEFRRAFWWHQDRALWRFPPAAASPQQKRQRRLVHASFALRAKHGDRVNCSACSSLKCSDR